MISEQRGKEFDRNINIAGEAFFPLNTLVELAIKRTSEFLGDSLSGDIFLKDFAFSGENKINGRDKLLYEISSHSKRIVDKITRVDNVLDRTATLLYQMLSINDNTRKGYIISIYIGWTKIHTKYSSRTKIYVEVEGPDFTDLIQDLERSVDELSEMSDETLKLLMGEV